MWVQRREHIVVVVKVILSTITQHDLHIILLKIIFHYLHLLLLLFLLVHQIVAPHQISRGHDDTIFPSSVYTLAEQGGLLGVAANDFMGLRVVVVGGGVVVSL